MSVLFSVRTVREADVRITLLPECKKVFKPHNIIVSDQEQVACFDLAEGRYLVCVKKEGCYALEQCVDLENDTEISFPALLREGRGFEPQEDKPVFRHKEDAWSKMAPDQDDRWQAYSVIYDTPYFQKKQCGNGAYRITTQNELVDFLSAQQAKNPHMSVFSLGKTGIYGFDMPLVVLSKDLPAGVATVEAAGEILRRSSKPTVFYQAQIHGNEPASGEAALGMIAYLSTPQGAELLERIHIVIFPRMNPEGAMLFQRRNAQGLDLNRDYLAARAKETRASLRVFHAFLPCVVIDGHEAAGRKGIKARVERNEDIQLSGGCAPNAHSELIDGNMVLLDNSLRELDRMGLRTYFYRDHVSGAGMATAIRYFAELGAPTVLIESRGIDLGTERFHRRVMGQFTVARTCLETVAKEPERFSAILCRELAHYENPYDRDFVLEGKYTDDPATDPAYPIAYLDTETGETEKITPKRVVVFRVPVRLRPRPQSYWIPLGEAWENSLIALLERHRIQYFRHEKEVSLTLRAFQKENADYTLSEPMNVSFRQGALEIPVSQKTSHIVSFLFEMDSVDPVEAKKMIALDTFFFPDEKCFIYRKEND